MRSISGGMSLKYLGMQQRCSSERCGGCCSFRGHVFLSRKLHPLAQRRCCCEACCHSSEVLLSPRLGPSRRRVSWSWCSSVAAAQRLPVCLLASLSQRVANPSQKVTSSLNQSLLLSGKLILRRYLAFLIWKLFELFWEQSSNCHSGSLTILLHWLIVYPATDWR